jgi:DNA invertase Pin-like site-specific DNA recombinase
MNVVVYARVSTDDKDQDPARQFLKCQQYCDIHEHIVIGQLDDSCSGDSDPFRRQGFIDLLKLNPQGIIIFSMDRLTRQHPVKVFQMIKRFKDLGIKIISITEPAFNMEGEFSEILLFMITWFNNYFLIKLKRDTKAGMERARLQGKVIGRSKVVFNHFRAEELLKQMSPLGVQSLQVMVEETPGQGASTRIGL